MFTDVSRRDYKREVVDGRGNLRAASSWQCDAGPRACRQTPFRVSSPKRSASPQRHAIDETRLQRCTDILLPSCFAAYVIIPCTSCLPSTSFPHPSPLSTLVTTSLSTVTDVVRQFISLPGWQFHPGPALFSLSMPSR